MKSNRSTTRILTFTLAIFVTLLQGCSLQQSNLGAGKAAATSQDQQRAEEIYESSSQAEALSKVSGFAQGVWTYTEKPAAIWFRLVVYPNDVATLQMAYPSQDGWQTKYGPPALQFSLPPCTGKYSDTGNRWYGLADSCGSSPYLGGPLAGQFVIEKDGTLTYSYKYFDGPITTVTMARGDVFPFQ